MTTGERGTEPAFAVSALSIDERDRLGLLPDEEQRSILYRQLLAQLGIEGPTDLSVAENVLLYPILKDNVFTKLPVLPEEYINYFTAYGTDTLRQLIAERLGNSFGVPGQLDWNNVFGTAGVSAALRCIAQGLQWGGAVPQGSTALLPAPFWQGFYWPFHQEAGLTCHPVPLLEAGEEKFQLTLKDLQREYQKAQSPKLLVLTNPHNPLGVNYDKKLLESIYGWALGNTDMHIISDEIYCHSQLQTATTPFVSALQLEAIKNHEDHVHVVWGFAKDFGLSGFRAGFVISRSKDVRTAMLGMNSNDPNDRRISLSQFTPFDSLKHFYILNLLQANDNKFWEQAMAKYRELLTPAFNAVAQKLDTYQVKYVHDKGSNSAQFFFLDLREFLPKAADAASSVLFANLPDPESRLANDILINAQVKLLTGTALSCPWPGYFRLCFTCTDTTEVVAAVKRMGKYLRGLR